MRALVAAALVAATGMCGTTVPLVASVAVMKHTGGSSHAEQERRLDRRQVHARHQRHQTAVTTSTAPRQAEVGKYYQEGSYIYTIGPDGRRWYEPTVCPCGPQ